MMNNGIELQRESPYFDRDIAVTISSTTEDSKIASLTFRIIPGTKQTKNAGHVERVIHFEFSNENDPYFLYLLDVCESDFHQLKRDQSILVEFNVFPTKLIELLDLCTPLSNHHDPNQPPSNISSSAFTVKLDETTGVFSIIESNMFKQITHISLQLRTGNDASIKAYLASRLNYTLASYRRLSHDLGKCQLELESEKQSKSSVSSELQELRYELLLLYN